MCWLIRWEERPHAKGKDSQSTVSHAQNIGAERKIYKNIRRENVLQIKLLQMNEKFQG